MAPTKDPTEGELRRQVEKTSTELDKARNKWKANLDDKSGRELRKARDAASVALRDLWSACPEEKPPTQHVI